MRTMLGEPLFTPGDATLIYRSAAADRQLFAAELTMLPDVRVLHLTGPRRDADSWLPAGYLGADHDVLRELAPEVTDSDVYLCGPPGWVASVKRAARRAGVRRHQLHTEEFAW